MLLLVLLVITMITDVFILVMLVLVARKNVQMFDVLSGRIDLHERRLNIQDEQMDKLERRD